MQVIHKRCCGLDVHKRKVTACIITPDGRETRNFGTMTTNLLELADWLAQYEVTHVAMESTGVYWKPIYNLLEDDFTVIVVNAHHIKAVPGRKTDMKDAEWIAELLRHGLVRGSFVPDRPQRELRELVRYRRGLIRERSQVISRIQKVLEGGNIKLSSVASDVMGASGRAMLEALAHGVEDPKILADMAKGSLRKKHEALLQALQGLMGQHQQVMLQSQLRHFDFLNEEIARLDEEVADRMRPFEEDIEHITQIPGLGRRSIEEILAETGVDMNRFPSDRHIASWARVCPGNNESAGKRKSGATGHGNPWLRSTLIEAAWSASRTKGTYLSSRYHRIAARRGKKRAAMAIAHTILVTIYHMLRDHVSYRELGDNYFDERRRTHVIRRAVRRIENLGYEVTLAPRHPVFS